MKIFDKMLIFYKFENQNCLIEYLKDYLKLTSKLKGPFLLFSFFPNASKLSGSLSVRPEKRKKKLTNKRSLSSTSTAAEYTKVCHFFRLAIDF